MRILITTMDLKTIYCFIFLFILQNVFLSCFLHYLSKFRLIVSYSLDVC
jgi:hypothetical protein